MTSQLKRKRLGNLEDGVGDKLNGLAGSMHAGHVDSARLVTAGAAGQASSSGGLAPGAVAGPSGSVDVDLSLLDKVEREAGGAAAAVEVLDLRGLRRLVLGLEKKLKENLELRMKYAGQPEKFMDSELELDAEVKKLQALASAPHLYPDFVRLNAMPSLLSTLSHENTDVAVQAVGVLSELTDADAVGEFEEEAKLLVGAILEGNGLELLAQNLARMNEADAEEAAAVFNTLSVFENVVEVRPDAADIVGERTKLLRWLLSRLKAREFDANKLYASEMLAILLQNSTPNQRRVGQMNGVDTLLQAVAQYKSRDPRTAEEEEMVENVYDTLCSVVLLEENRERFVRAEGVELMIIVMKQRRGAYASALKLLDFALTRCPPACERFVDVLGLKTLFATLMGKVPVKKKTKAETLQARQELEERVVSILASLSMNLPKGTRRDRLLSKFVEKEYEKIDRILEVYLRYLDKVKAEEKRQREQEEDMEDDNEQGALLTEEDKYLARLDAGLFTLQLAALILAHLFSLDHSGIQERIDLLLKQQHLSRNHLREVLQEHLDNIGDMNGAEERERRRAQVQGLISSL